MHMQANVCFKKTGTNYSTVSLLWFVQVFLKQTLNNELVSILETDWLYCAWQSRQEKILRMSVSRLGELFVVAREGEHAHFLRIHISTNQRQQIGFKKQTTLPTVCCAGDLKNENVVRIRIIQRIFLFPSLSIINLMILHI